MRVRNTRTGAPLGERVILALSARSRFRGLLGRRQLVPGEGLWLEPCSSIHMFFMAFPIDVVFVDRQGKVVRPVANVRPWRIALGGLRARAALELPVGVIDRSQTRSGDHLEIRRA